MSSAIAAVKFNDGSIKYTLYHGTSDVLASGLMDKTNVFDFKYNLNGECRCGNDEPVEIMSTYGGGFYWKGRACKKCMSITDGRAPYGDEYSPLNTPTEEEYKLEREKLDKKDGEPDWSPWKNQ